MNEDRRKDVQVITTREQENKQGGDWEKEMSNRQASHEAQQTRIVKRQNVFKITLPNCSYDDHFYCLFFDGCK